MALAVSVVIAAVGRREPTWDRVRNCLAALARQEGGVAFEVLLCGLPELPGQTPADFVEILPALRDVDCGEAGIAARRTCAAQQASAPVVAFLEADCLAPPDWVARIEEAFRYYPEVAVVRGPSPGGPVSRWLGWLPQRRLPGPVHRTAVNNVAFRRDAYLDYPLAPGIGEREAIRLQSAAMRQAHYLLWQDPGLRVIRDRRGLVPAGGVAANRPAEAR